MSYEEQCFWLKAYGLELKASNMINFLFVRGQNLEHQGAANDRITRKN